MKKIFFSFFYLIILLLVSPAWTAPQPGDVVLFGNYYMSTNNTKEPVEWIVLEKNPFDKTYLLISRYILDAVSFNGENAESNNWCDSYLRQWLNKTFKEECFSEADQNQIVEYDLFDNTKNDFAKDKVFLLSGQEAWRLFGSRQERIGKPTLYARTKHIFIDEYGACMWALRPDLSNDYCFVMPDGAPKREIPSFAMAEDGSNSYGGENGIRPCIFLKDDTVLKIKERAKQETADFKEPIVYTGTVNVSVGDTILFGYAEQDGKNNGKESIEWLVVDKTDDTILVISSKCLYFMEYGAWEDSKVRSFLNGAFYNNAFSKAEKELIVNTDISTDYYVYDDDYPEGKLITEYTTDKIFLLSADLLDVLFHSHAARNCVPSVTANPEKWENRLYNWRTRDNCLGSALVNEGKIDVLGATDVSPHGIRPAMKLRLSHKTVQSEKYIQAIMAADKKDYINFIKLIQSLDGYKDSKELLNKELKHNNLIIGDLVQLGRFGNEPIFWQVIDSDKDAVLLISLFAISQQEYDNRYERDLVVSWDECSLRRWLNNDFYNSCFNDAEKQMLLKTSVSYMKDNKTSYVNDNVFCLSAAEAGKLFENNKDRQSEMPNGMTTRLSKSSQIRWWTRTIGTDKDHAVCVLADGSIDEAGALFGESRGVEIGLAAVRPCIWVKGNELVK